MSSSGRVVRLGVEDVDGADAVAVGGDDGGGGEEPDAPFAADEGIAGGSGFGEGVGYHARNAVEDRGAAQSEISLDVIQAVQTVRRLEPDAIGIDDRDGRHRGL